MIEVRCPTNGTTYHAAEAHLGKSVRCRACGTIFKLDRRHREATSSGEEGPMDPKTPSEWVSYFRFRRRETD